MKSKLRTLLLYDAGIDTLCAALKVADALAFPHPLTVAQAARLFPPLAPKDART